MLKRSNFINYIHSLNTNQDRKNKQFTVYYCAVVELEDISNPTVFLSDLAQELQAVVNGLSIEKRSLRNHLRNLCLF